MITFKPIALEDKELISRYYPLYGNGDCNFSFISLYARQKQEESFYALVNGQLVIRCKFGNGQSTYTMPAGSGDQKKTILLLKEQAEREDSPLYMYPSGLRMNFQVSLSSIHIVIIVTISTSVMIWYNYGENISNLKEII